MILRLLQSLVYFQSSEKLILTIFTRDLIAFKKEIFRDPYSVIPEVLLFWYFLKSEIVYSNKNKEQLLHALTLMNLTEIILAKVARHRLHTV